MKDVTALELGRKPWFTGMLAFLGALLAYPLLRAAGIGMPQDWAQWLVFFLCYFAIWRCLGFALWFAVLLMAPNSKLLASLDR